MCGWVGVFWAVRWPPIGSSSPLTPWYAWNVLPFSAQSQPARFQVETRETRVEDFTLEGFEGGWRRVGRARGCGGWGVGSPAKFKTTLKRKEEESV